MTFADISGRSSCVVIEVMSDECRVMSDESVGGTQHSALITHYSVHGISPGSPGDRSGVKWYLLSTMKNMRFHRVSGKNRQTTRQSSFTRSMGGASGGGGLPLNDQ